MKKKSLFSQTKIPSVNFHPSIKNNNNNKVFNFVKDY